MIEFSLKCCLDISSYFNRSRIALNNRCAQVCAQKALPDIVLVLFLICMLIYGRPRIPADLILREGILIRAVRVLNRKYALNPNLIEYIKTCRLHKSTLACLTVTRRFRDYSSRYNTLHTISGIQLGDPLVDVFRLKRRVFEYRSEPVSEPSYCDGRTFATILNCSKVQVVGLGPC